MRAVINYNPKVFEEAVELDNFYKTNNNKLKGKLHCIPLLVKDNIDVRGLPTTGGIKALRNSIPNKDALVVERLRKEGGIVMAKANLAELAAGPYDSELGGECLNPYDYTRSCGPSSTGTGAGIATGMAVIGLGTDTEGSIMNPSAFGSLFGLRPPHNQLSLDGIVPAFERQDTVGPLTKHLDDLVLAYSIMLDNQKIYENFVNPVKRTLKLGFIKNFYTPFNISNIFGTFTYLIDPEIKEAIVNAKENLRKLGVEIFDLELSHANFDKLNNISLDIIIERNLKCVSACMKPSFDAYFSNSQRFEHDSPIRSFKSFKESPFLTSYWKNMLESADLNDACDQTCSKYEQLRQDFTKIIQELYGMNSVDALVFPTINDLPYVLSEIDSMINASPTFLSPYTKYGALSIPIAFSKPTVNATQGLPIGMMLLSPKENIESTLQVAKLYDENYIKVKVLPLSTPKIDKICLQNNASTLQNLSNFICFCFVLLLNFLFKI